MMSPQHGSQSSDRQQRGGGARGRSPLWLAASEGELSTVHELLRTSVRMDLQDKDERTPLFAACFQGHTQVARALLTTKARVDLQDKLGASPLYIACLQVDRASAG